MNDDIVWVPALRRSLPQWARDEETGCEALWIGIRKWLLWEVGPGQFIPCRMVYAPDGTDTFCRLWEGKQALNKGMAISVCARNALDWLDSLATGKEPNGNWSLSNWFASEGQAKITKKVGL